CSSILLDCCNQVLEAYRMTWVPPVSGVITYHVCALSSASYSESTRLVEKEEYQYPFMYRKPRLIFSPYRITANRAATDLKPEACTRLVILQVLGHVYSYVSKHFSATGLPTWSNTNNLAHHDRGRCTSEVFHARGNEKASARYIVAERILMRSASPG